MGAHLTDSGARFSVASGSAEAVELCLIDEFGAEERRIELAERTFGVWHGSVDGVRAGQRYGYRVHGRYDPAAGLHANPAKLLVDPYTRRITGRLTSLPAALDYAEDPLHGSPSTVDSLGAVPLSVVTSPVSPATEPRPDVPWADTVIYELHVRGFTRCHPEVPERLRGSYLGLAHPAVLEYLRGLGVTAVELLPVHAFCDEPQLLTRGMHNYWGYATLGFLAPHAAYAAEPGEEVAEFRAMVEALHGAGIEVILDVVYNHTCEGGVGGPTLCYRGLDSPAYYARHGNGELANITGTGNTLDPASLTVARLVADSLRHWSELGVDGFRFDLASVLGRPGAGPFDPRAGLLNLIAADPLLATRKLIAEPWDATGDGYRVGGFGAQWSEWNDRFRDTARDFWRGATGVNELASRLTGSSDLYAASERRPWASVNFVTAHDGFTLRDLVSYRRKHNEANGEQNRDGSDHNRSQNFGVEGETPDAGVRAGRLATARALLTTLLLATGTPMITAGDERWRTQGGNNNAYCQDNPISWLDWTPDADADAMTAFTRRLLELRRHPLAPDRNRFLSQEDVVWWHPSGRTMADPDWHDPAARTLGMLAGGHWLLLLHAGSEPTDCVLPDVALAPVLDSTDPTGTPPDPTPLSGGAVLPLPARSALLLLAAGARAPV
ncbi:glycogen debranching protein GlgX [Pseudonocardia eucalypti]|uniref:Glycogen debranching protein GlgX n=1 Tax=Pseudonocardia eucalypti TaxID=648755 RepID=A0ABP9QAL2_9PSEU|nr:glycogen operon protein [Pseudonocardia eucalypti]